MTNQSFPERQGFAPPAQPVGYDGLPGYVRSAFSNTLREFIVDRAAVLSPGVFNSSLYECLKPHIWKVMLTPPGNPQGGPWNYYIPTLIQQCQWWQFYEICEDVYKLIARSYGQPGAEVFAQEANGLFARDGLVWQFKEGRIERMYNPRIAQKVEEARTLLRDPRFKGADEQFTKAVDHLNKRPSPDKENCVKDAVGAVEAMARIVCADHESLLSHLLNKEPLESGIHQDLRDVIRKLYAYRGNAGGVAHGQVGASEVGVEEAEWVLSIAAGTILYLVSKFGRQVK